MSASLEGKVAVVLGGGNGIPRACSERFAREGAAVVVADLLDDAGEAVVAEITPTMSPRCGRRSTPSAGSTSS